MSKKKSVKKQKSAKRKRVAKKKATREVSASAPVESLLSLRSMESLLAGFVPTGTSGRSDLDDAQEIMYEAWETPDRYRALALAEKALDVSPDCADAYIFLAEESAKSLEEATALYRKAVEAGERALGEEAFEEDVGHFWGLLETRPYMRARLGLAQCLREAGQLEEAVEHYWDLLRLNPDDNQGIRDLLMPCLIELGRDGEAERLFEQYEESSLAAWRYSRVLLDFRKAGDSPASREALQAALRENRHVPSYLLGRKRMPRTLPDHYGLGDDNEAVLYVHGNKAAWKASPGAMEWLSAQLD